MRCSAELATVGLPAIRCADATRDVRSAKRVFQHVAIRNPMPPQLSSAPGIRMASSRSMRCSPPKVWHVSLAVYYRAA